MVVGAFPAVKLAVLAFKQLSKPVANTIKERAKSHPFFRKYVCMPPAQFYNWVEVKTRMWVLNLGKPVKVPQLNETQAIELGANLLGETVIYAIGAGLLIFEYKRQANKEQAREEMILEEKRELQYTLQELALNIERQDAQIRHLQRTVADLESRKWLPKIPILQKSKQNDEDDNNNNNNINSNSNMGIKPTSNTTGNYDPNNGLLLKSLDLIENEIFYSENTNLGPHRIIHEALDYLKLN